MGNKEMKAALEASFVRFLQGVGATPEGRVRFPPATQRSKFSLTIP